MSDLLKNTSLSLNTADKIISETLHKCDDGELYLEDTKFETVTLDDNKIKSSDYSTDTGYGFRAVTDDVIAYSEETPFEYPVLVGEEEAIAIAENANIEFIGLPFTMLVDDQNEIIKTHLGEIKEHHIDMLTEVIRGMQRGKISVEEAKLKLGKI